MGDVSQRGFWSSFFHLLGWKKTTENDQKEKWARGTTAEPEAYKRLLQAMKSMSPGGWNEDLWERTRQYNKSVVPTAVLNFKDPNFEPLPVAEIERIRQEFEQAFDGGKLLVTPPGGEISFLEPRYGKKDWDLLDRFYAICTEKAKQTVVDLGFKDKKPNTEQTVESFVDELTRHLYWVGETLIWTVPNRLGIPYELFVVPVCIAVPQPSCPDYPDGYYRIQPIYPYGPFSSYPTPSTSIGAAIPVQWMKSVKVVHPVYSFGRGDDQVETDRLRWYAVLNQIPQIDLFKFSQTK